MRLGPGWTEGQGRGVGQVGLEREGVRGHPEPLRREPAAGAWASWRLACISRRAAWGVVTRSGYTGVGGAPGERGGVGSQHPFVGRLAADGECFQAVLLSLSLTSIFHRPGPRSRGQVGALRPCELLPRPRRGRARHRVDRRWRYLRLPRGLCHHAPAVQPGLLELSLVSK